MKYFIITVSLLLLTSFAYADTAPVVSNVVMLQRNDNSELVDITYDLADAENDICAVSIIISADEGNTFSIIPTQANLSGDIGEGVIPGTGKHIIWNIGAESNDFQGSQYRAKVTADDRTGGFVYVPGGSFNNGTSNVTVSSLFMCKYELTQAEYQVVMGVNPSVFTGVSNGPVEQVSWFNAIEYCNRRSINEGLTPCYTYNNGTNYGTNPATWPGGWNIINGNHTNVSCNWSANGYRLPSEAEWQYAAMGGNQSHNYTYSGSNDLNAVGWYNENSGNTSHTVGTLTANELGLFDMSGNVWEWNWDIYGGYPSGSQNNPHGAVSGSSRVIRGGGWFNGVDYCTVSIRNATDATASNAEVGFRWVRVSP